jgi:hypothetical protein
MMGIFLSILIFGSSMAALRFQRDYFLTKYTRDAVQIMYLLIPTIGLHGYSTNISFAR